MNRESKALERLMETPKIRNLGLREEVIVSILKSYKDIQTDLLLENGYIELDNGIYVEVVKLTDRVHVLRGVTYKNNRSYKLKVTMDESMYKRIGDYYDNLMKEIE